MTSFIGRPQGSPLQLDKELDQGYLSNAAYVVTLYSDYTQYTDAGNPKYCNTTLEGTDAYSRTNGVFGISMNYKF